MAGTVETEGTKGKGAGASPPVKPVPPARRDPATSGAPSTSTSTSTTALPADDELAARLRVAVTRLHRRLRQESFSGISPSQEAVLAAIKRLGRPTLGELAQAERVQPPTMTRVIRAMQSAGLVARHADAGDRRVSRVALTESGRSALERIRSMKTAYLAQRLARLDDDERARAAGLAMLLEELVEDR